MITTIIILLIILMIYCFYILYRNNHVYRFMVSLSDILFGELKRIIDTYEDDNEFLKDENNYNYIKERTQLLLDKYSYEKYLFSFKPLKLEKWFNEEELEFIGYLKQYRK